nr:MAG TPA: hypothetical protein [Caudoviricetes sp.]
MIGVTASTSISGVFRVEPQPIKPWRWLNYKRIRGFQN